MSMITQSSFLAQNVLNREVQNLSNGKRPVNFDKHKTVPLPKYEPVMTTDHEKPAVYKARQKNSKWRAK